jgi:ubiquinone/menaquinone biosynthesis C-methylase UbiE
VSGARVTDYDRIADRYDTRYGVYDYAGVRETLVKFLGDASSIVEVGCGTGHWLSVVDARLKPSRYDDIAAAPVKPSPHTRGAKALAERLVGIDPSAQMLARAASRGAKASAERESQGPAERSLLARARAEDLPFADASFDRIYCVNALHHFSDRARFFAEAKRVLKPGGGLLTIGKDPHTEHDDWWVYTYFEETRAIDRERYARVRTLRGELALAGFAWTESLEAERIEIVQPASEALANGIVAASFTSQLTVLSEEEFGRGAEKLRRANEAAGGELQLVADFRLYATIGWK